MAGVGVYKSQLGLKLEAVNYLPNTGWFKLDVNLVN